ncbi:MAG: hypothetical protein ABH861_04000 [Patescibacteria group bacterium]
MSEETVLWRHGCMLRQKGAVYFTPVNYWRKKDRKQSGNAEAESRQPKGVTFLLPQDDDAAESGQGISSCREEPSPYGARPSYFIAIMATVERWRIRLIPMTAKLDADMARLANCEKLGYNVIRDEKSPVRIRPIDTGDASHLKLLVLHYAKQIRQMFHSRNVSLMVQSAEFVLGHPGPCSLPR